MHDPYNFMCISVQWSIAVVCVWSGAASRIIIADADHSISLFARISNKMLYISITIIFELMCYFLWRNAQCGHALSLLQVIDSTKHRTNRTCWTKVSETKEKNTRQSIRWLKCKIQRFLFTNLPWMNVRTIDRSCNSRWANITSRI